MFQDGSHRGDKSYGTDLVISPAVFSRLRITKAPATIFQPGARLVRWEHCCDLTQCKKALGYKWLHCVSLLEIRVLLVNFLIFPVFFRETIVMVFKPSLKLYNRWSKSYKNSSLHNQNTTLQHNAILPSTFQVFAGCVFRALRKTYWELS